MAMTNIESITLLDLLPTEIVFHIFNYLSSNDIIYTFFYFTQRFNHLLLQNQRYLIHLELPTTNLNLWRNILSHISSQIELLNISTIDLSCPLSLFQNLKSLIISSPYGFSDEELKSIVESDKFNNLNSLKIKERKIFPNCTFSADLTNEEDIFKKVFNNQNSLKTFQYSSIIISFLDAWTIDSLKTNFNLHSLTLILTNFQHIFLLIEYTPNLKYLNIKAQFLQQSDLSIKKIDIKLKELYLKFEANSVMTASIRYMEVSFDALTNFIKQFSSSLICLSLNLALSRNRRIDELPFNSFKLKQFLESMTELKQFHLYAVLTRFGLNLENILEPFQDQFWFDHNWSFGTHGRYFYTLPFHLDHLYLDRSFKGFNDVKSNNPEILETNHRLWYHVKSIDLYFKSKYDFNFMKKLKIKMPRLTTIIFRGYSTRPSNEIQDLSDRTTVQLDSVTTVHFACESIEMVRDWLIYALPNAKYLILSSVKFPSIKSDLAPILNRQIQQLFIDITGKKIEQLAETSYVYFSNVHHIYLDFSSFCSRTSKQYVDLVMKILRNFENLKILVIYTSAFNFREAMDMERELHKLIKYLDMNEIQKNYQVKYNRECSLFSKKTLDR